MQKHFKFFLLIFKKKNEKVVILIFKENDLEY
jgi:hypothetical protein